MSEKQQFSLPGSGYDVLTKILHAYAVSGNNKIALSAVSAKSGLGETMVSRNNQFLVSLGILEGGRAKSLTDLGRPLAIAIGNSIVEDIRNEWKRILVTCPATKSILDMVKIQKGVPKDQLSSRIASSLGVIAGDSNKTGVNTLIELFEKSELMEIRENRYQLREDVGPDTSNVSIAPPHTEGKPESTIPTEEPKGGTQESSTDTNMSGLTSNSQSRGGIPSLHIDLQIHISPEATPDQIDQVFASIAKHLYKKEGE